MERSSLKRESFDNLLGGPLGSRVFGNIEVDNLSSVMGQNKEDKQHFEGCRRNDDEVDGDKVFDVSVSVAPTKPRRGGWRVEVETSHCNPVGNQSHPVRAGQPPEASLASSSVMAARSVDSECKSRVIEPRNDSGCRSLRGSRSGGNTVSPIKAW